MNRIQWRDDLLTGVTEIDDQHKELFERINNLFDACRVGKSKEEAAKILDFLGGYCIEHFGMEEKYQQQFSYPEYETHKSEHNSFIKNFAELKAEIQQNGIGIATVVNINSIVADWLINHIEKMDKKMALFLKQHMYQKA